MGLTSQSFGEKKIDVILKQETKEEYLRSSM